MSPKELKALAKTMRELGVTHYKAGDIELTLSPEAPQKPAKRKEIPDDSKDIKHRVDDLTSIMKLGDEELIDRLFPIHSDELEA